MTLPTCQKPLPIDHNQYKKTTKLNILAAEDNAINQLIIEKLIVKLGHKATIVNNGQEALEILKKVNFDFVFMDCDMPVLDGYQAVKQFREYEESNQLVHLPIFALTAHAYKDHDLKVKEFGMDGQVLKPIKPTEIEELLNSIKIN